MTQMPASDAVQLYALRLATPDPLRRDALAGCLEHVLTGEQHAFDSGDALLTLLVAGPAADATSRWR